jgi:uncharacterized protein with HEPN domain
LTVLFFLFFNESIDKIIKYTKDMKKNQFLSDDKTFDAVMRNLQIIGEAVKQFPMDIREKYPKVSWKKIAGLRDIVTHEYFGIDEDIIWDVVHKKIPELKLEVEKIIKEIFKKGPEKG